MRDERTPKDVCGEAKLHQDSTISHDELHLKILFQISPGWYGAEKVRPLFRHFNAAQAALFTSQLVR